MSKSAPESVLTTERSPAQLTVRLGALGGNYRELLRRAGPAAVAPVVKADAYGLGLTPVAHALNLAGADTYFVARLDEGIALRALIHDARIFVLDGLAPGTAPALIAHRLIPVLNGLEEIEEWSAAARAQKTQLQAAVQIDTGMNRSGLSHVELSQLAPRMRQSLAGIDLVLVLSHLARADEPGEDMNWVQLARFRAALAVLPSAPASLAASAGIELGRDYLFDMVRPGLAIYGGNPIAGRPNPYRTVAVLTGRVLQVRHVAVGDSVGYAATFAARRPSTIATIAIGYADGLIRALGPKGCVAIAGVRVPFAGRLSMDVLGLDATDVPPDALARGTEAEFFGDTIALDEAAEAAGTIAHEVLASLTPRVRRVYVED